MQKARGRTAPGLSRCYAILTPPLSGDRGRVVPLRRQFRQGASGRDAVGVAGAEDALAHGDGALEQGAGGGHAAVGPGLRPADPRRPAGHSVGSEMTTRQPGQLKLALEGGVEYVHGYSLTTSPGFF